MARRRIGDPASLEALDVGAGIGLVDEHLTGDFGRVVGLDVSSAMVERAAERNPGAEYVAYDGTTFPFETASFGVVFASCVFHHVPVGERARLAGEMARVTRPGGLAIILEHNPINPATRFAVSRCEFDEDAVLMRMSESRCAARGRGAAGRRALVHPLLPVSQHDRAAPRPPADGRAVLRRGLAAPGADRERGDVTLTPKAGWLVLVGLVAVAVALRVFEALRVPMPWIMPDEFLYAELGRSAYASHSLDVLGRDVPFYSFVHPLLIGGPLRSGIQSAAIRSRSAFRSS